MKIVEMNLLDVPCAAVICHQVNCLGVMGGGLALQIRNKWGHVYEAYTNKKDWFLGDCQIVGIDYYNGLFIANLAGQEDISENATCIASLALALRTARDFAEANDLQLYLPYMIGCGIGGGDWNKVKAMIEEIAPNAILCKLP